MGMIYYFKDVDPRSKFNGRESMFKRLPSIDTVLLLKALFFKKEKFRKTADRIICTDDILTNFIGGATIMQLGCKTYSCDKHRVDIFECLLELLEDLPDNVLIETHTGFLEEADYIRQLFSNYYGKLMPEWFQKIFADIQQLCNKKKIYFDINPYGEIAIHKEPIETWISTKDKTNRRYCFIKYEDTYIDGHVDYHEEDEPIGIVDKVLISYSDDVSRSLLSYKKTFEVTYEDGYVGRVYEEGLKNF